MWLSSNPENKNFWVQISWKIQLVRMEVQTQSSSE